MQNLPALNNGQKINTLDLLAKINEFRKDSGEGVLGNRHFNARIKDELSDDNPVVKILRPIKGGTPQEYFELTQEQVLLVGMRESKAVRRNVLGWLKALQNQKPALPDFNDPVASARAWADEVEEKRAAIVLLEQQKPAVEFVESYTKTEGLKGFRQVCKLLKVKEPEFRRFLTECKIMYKLGDEWTAYQQHLDAKRFEIKAVKGEKRNFNTTFFTAKGITWVVGELAKYKLSKKEI